jgi:tetratricopeptide (TPR) repeat protein
VSESPRIEDLRRRVQRDPTSIAFAQLAEELRRAGLMQEAIETCRAGLAIHPGYISARVTLARALTALDRLEDAKAELERVLRSAPENLAANRALADVWSRLGNTPEALARYRAALALAHNDPELQQIVARLCLDGARPPAYAEPVQPVLPDAGATATPDLYGRPALAPPAPQPLLLSQERGRALRTIAALEQVLEVVRSRNETSTAEDAEVQS